MATYDKFKNHVLQKKNAFLISVIFLFLFSYVSIPCFSENIKTPNTVAQGQGQELKNEIFENSIMTFALSKLFQNTELPVELLFKLSTFVMHYENAQKVYAQTRQKLILKYADIDFKTKQPLKIKDKDGNEQYTISEKKSEYLSELQKLLDKSALMKPEIEIAYTELPKDLLVPVILAQLRKVIIILDK